MTEPFVEPISIDVEGPKPIKPLPPEVEEYIKNLEKWLSVAVQLGTYDVETAQNIAYGAGKRVAAGEPVSGMPFYREIAEGIDPAAHFQYARVGRPAPERVKKEREYAQYLKQREFAWKQPWKSWFEPKKRVFEPSKDIPYERAFKQELAGFEGSKPWEEWFVRSFPSFVKRFQTTLPEYRKRWGPERLQEEGEKLTKSWAEYLREAREGYYDLSPWERGERPSAYAPRIRTVRF